ncbi:MAG: 1,4-dihydroxy-2-naphthoate octaprenyltransferase [Planctomycetota bacterium]
MTIYQILMTKYQRLFTNDYQISTKEYVRKNQQIMQNKPNFMRFSPENADFTKKQTQFKPNLSSIYCLLYSVSNIDFSFIKAIICEFLNLFYYSYQKVKTVETNSKKSKFKSLFQASRPNFLAASVAPVLVGSTLAYAITGSFNFGLFFLAMLAIMLLHAGANMANDYFDHLSGNDWANNNVTPFSGGSRSIQDGIVSPRTELLAALVALAAGSAIGLIIVLLTKSLFILILGAIGLLGGFFYTAPPVKLGYRCVGECVIALLFGLLPVFGSYYLQTGTIDIIPLLPAAVIAVLIFLIILINEFPDLAADASVNKKTLIVRLGVPASVWIYRIVLISGFIFAAAMLIYRTMFFAGLLYLLTLPVAVLAVKAANKKDLVKPGLFRANQLTVILHTAGSLALTIGFIIMGLRYTAV